MVDYKVLLLCLLLLVSCNKAEQEIVVVHENYIGRVLIVFDQTNGTDTRYEKGKRIYKLPSECVLKTKFSPNPGWIGLPKFYYNKITKESELSFRLNRNKLPKDSIVAFGGIAGSVLVKNERIKFLEYYIGNSLQIDTAYERAQITDITKLVQ